MNKRVSILVALLVLVAAGIAVWSFPMVMDSDPSDDSPSAEEYPPLTDVQGADVVLRGSDSQIQVRYTSEIMYCTIRDTSTGNELERIEPVEPNDTWDYTPSDVSVTCQPTGDGYIDEFPEQQEYRVEIE